MMKIIHQCEDHGKKIFLAERSVRPETLKLFEEEKECQGVWNVVNEDKRAMRQ